MNRKKSDTTISKNLLNTRCHGGKISLDTTINGASNIETRRTEPVNISYISGITLIITSQSPNVLTIDSIYLCSEDSMAIITSSASFFMITSRMDSNSPKCSSWVLNSEEKPLLVSTCTKPTNLLPEDFRCFFISSNNWNAFLLLPTSTVLKPMVRLCILLFVRVVITKCTIDVAKNCRQNKVDTD